MNCGSCGNVLEIDDSYCAECGASADSATNTVQETEIVVTGGTVDTVNLFEPDADSVTEVSPIVTPRLCASCGNEIESDAVFCIECGTPVVTHSSFEATVNDTVDSPGKTAEIADDVVRGSAAPANVMPSVATPTFCGSCGASLEADASFCIACGNPVTSLQEAESAVRHAPTEGGWSTVPISSGHSWLVRTPGQSDVLVDLATLQSWARSRRVRAETTIVDYPSGTSYAAVQIPGVFSDKDFTTALLLSIFLGWLGIDRFYLGHTGMGIGKLLTFGGLGIWSLVDMIMVATRNVTDGNGRALA